MIPIDQIIPGNPYSQDDAVFLMGEGFSEDAAKEIVCEACRSGQLKASKWRKRWWFAGRAFVEWVARWFGAEIESDDGQGEEGVVEARDAVVVAYVGQREDGPLFLSPDGLRIDPVNNLDTWREALFLAIVDMEWPEDEPRDVMLESFVARAIKPNSVRVARGGPKTGKNAPGPEKLAERKRRAETVRRISDGIRESVVERMKGVDQHCLRKTHRTWALMAGVPEILIDRQLGHTSRGGDAALKAAWSLVGRSHYTDMNMLSGDARRSAEAVRKMLDRAEDELQEITARGETALVSSSKDGLRAAAV